MGNKKIVVDTELDIINYVKCVDDIVSKYFNDEEEYTPEMGILHTMCVFYNLCVKESSFKDSIGDEISIILDIKDIAKDDDFLKAFNEAISEPDSFGLNFNNAYKQAMDIVENKKNPVNNIITLVKMIGTGLSGSMDNFVNMINNVEAEENSNNEESESTIDS